MSFLNYSTDLLDRLKTISRGKKGNEQVPINSDQLAEVIRNQEFYFDKLFCEDNIDFIQSETIEFSFADWFKTIYTNNVKALIREMTLYCKASVLLFNFRRNSHFSYLSLLFGLCCSSPTYIFDAIISASAVRIPKQ